MYCCLLLSAVYCELVDLTVTSKRVREEVFFHFPLSLLFVCCPGIVIDEVVICEPPELHQFELRITLVQTTLYPPPFFLCCGIHEILVLCRLVGTE